MRASTIRGLMASLETCERAWRKERIGQIAYERCIECGREAPQVDEQGGGLKGAKRSRSG